MNPVYCFAIIDFNVPGKPNPPPIQLTATVWIMSHYLPTGTLEKYAIEWTRPASPEVPLNIWVQLDNIITKSNPIVPKSCIEGSPLVFKDIHDKDHKLVKLEGNHLTIVPFDSDNETLFVNLYSISHCRSLFPNICVCVYFGNCFLNVEHGNAYSRHCNFIPLSFGKNKTKNYTRVVQEMDPVYL